MPDPTYYSEDKSRADEKFKSDKDALSRLLRAESFKWDMLVRSVNIIRKQSLEDFDILFNSDLEIDNFLKCIYEAMTLALNEQKISALENQDLIKAIEVKRRRIAKIVNDLKSEYESSKYELALCLCRDKLLKWAPCPCNGKPCSPDYKIVWKKVM